jgi:hypothetical protein
MTPKPAPFQKLLDKMRHAQPSRSLDREVHLLVFGSIRLLPRYLIPRYTSSMDAAHSLLRTADVQMLELTGSWEPCRPDVHPAWSVRYYTAERPAIPGEKGAWRGAIAAGTAPAIALCRAALVVLARSQGLTVKAE